jgi:hypothetical protein
MFDARSLPQRGIAAAFEFDEVKCQVNSRRHTPTGENVAVVDDARVWTDVRPGFA